METDIQSLDQLESAVLEGQRSQSSKASPNLVAVGAKVCVHVQLNSLPQFCLLNKLLICLHVCS